MEKENKSMRKCCYCGADMGTDDIFCVECGQMWKPQTEMPALTNSIETESIEEREVDKKRHAGLEISPKADVGINKVEASLKETIAKQQRAIQSLTVKNEELSKSNQYLREKKPFLQKKTVIIWLDLWFLLFLTGMLSWLNGTFPFGYTFSWIELLIPLIATILCWISLKKDHYIWHFLLCVFISISMIALPMLLENEYNPLYVFGIVELVIRMVYASAYCWLGCISLFREKC